MNVLLLNPKLQTWSPNVYPPLGLAYIASALEEDKHEVSIIDLNAKRTLDNGIIKSLVGVDVVGITGLITEFKEVMRLANLIKESKPEIKVILGGALATTHTKEMLANSKADCVVIGEGEFIIRELLQTIENNKDLGSVKGIAYRIGDNIAITSLPDPINELDRIKFPARHLLDMSRYTTHHFKSFGMKLPKINSTTLISSRGCPYNCTFCMKQVGGLKWRARSPQNIVNEIKQLHEIYGYDGFVFNDDTFVVNKKRVLEFCRLLNGLDFKVSWYCNGRVNLMDEEIIKAMRNSGCQGIAYGIESGNQDILNKIKKGITLEQIERVVELTKRYGIHVTGYFMIGILGDTRETIKQTFDFARKLSLDFYGFGITSPIHGTPMFYEAKEKGMIAKSELQDWSFHTSINMTQDCTDAELEKFNKDAFREFTIEKRYGKHYLFNCKLWFDGMKSIFFLLGKRNVSTLIKKAWGLIKK